MAISTADLLAAGLTAEKATEWAPHLNIAAEKYEITTPRRIAMFLAQCAHESSDFTRLVENLNYSAPAPTEWGTAMKPRATDGGTAEGARSSSRVTTISLLVVEGLALICLVILACLLLLSGALCRLGGSGARGSSTPSPMPATFRA